MPFIYPETDGLSNKDVLATTDLMFVNGKVHHAYELLHSRINELHFVLRSIMLDLRSAKILVGE